MRLPKLPTGCNVPERVARQRPVHTHLKEPFSSKHIPPALGHTAEIPQANQSRLGERSVFQRGAMSGSHRHNAGFGR